MTNMLTQGRIQTGNNSVKNIPKNKEEKKKTVVFEIFCALFRRTSYTAKRKWLKVSKTI